MVPALVKAPTVVKLAPPVSVKLPSLAARPLGFGKAWPLPLKPTAAPLPMVVIELGKLRVEPAPTFHVPAVKVPLESCVTPPVNESVPERATTTRVLFDVTAIVDVPVPADFSKVPLLAPVPPLPMMPASLCRS